jgi:carbonic anhydrase
MGEQSILEKLKAGVWKFQVEVHAKNTEHYQRAASTPQTPHTLVIACADSRVDVETITSSVPG